MTSKARTIFFFFWVQFFFCVSLKFVNKLAAFSYHFAKSTNKIFPISFHTLEQAFIITIKITNTQTKASTITTTTTTTFLLFEMDDHQDIEIPQYFICPISLQIMKDPVIAITGITYDRESIEHWLFQGNNNKSNTKCPVTKQPLPRDSDLTPNHTLRRLIQAWCADNSAYGIDRIPTPKAPVNKLQIIKLIKDLWKPQLQIKTLIQLEVFATENERNRKCMAEVDVPRAMLTYIVMCCDKNQVGGLEGALNILHFFKITSDYMKLSVFEIDKIVESFTWVLAIDDESIENHKEIKSHALRVLKNIEAASSKFLERLKPQLFQKIIRVLQQRVIAQQGINAALHVMLDACPSGSNRMMMVESGAVFELIELELTAPEKKTTELILGILFHLCSCADGRAQFLSHRAAIALVTKRIMQVSPAADDRAILILSLICKFSGNLNFVVQEMLRVGTVLKLCSFLQVDCAAYLKDKARELLRAHYDKWKDSPCIDTSVFTRLTR